MSSATTKPHPVLRGDIEGLRSVAVLFVLVYHLGVDRLSGGFAGVDVFFVISGFLITSGLLTEAERTGTVSLLRFYARRARRLLPAATVVLVFTTVAGWLVLPRGQWSLLATDVVAAALYVVNWALAFRSVDYLAEDAAVSAVQHYWSLSVEEQFYLVIPVLMIALAWVARRLGVSTRRVIAVALAVIVGASLVHSIRHTDTAPQTAYFFSTTRVWELGLGSLLACAVPVFRRVGERAAGVLAGAGLVLILGSGLLVTQQTPWPGSAALFPTVGTAAVIAAGIANPLTPVGRLLSVRPMVWIGGLSYSIYLWHWPLITLAGQVGELERWHKVLIAIASVGLAWLSKRLIEDPIRFGRLFAQRTGPTLVMGAAGMALSLSVAGVVQAQVPGLDDKPASAVGAAGLVQPGRDAGSTPTVPVLDPADITTTGPVYPDPAVATEDVPAYYADECQTPPGETDPDLRCVYGQKDGSVTVALTGDSKAGQWFDALNAIALERGWRLELYLKSACGLNPEQPKSDCRAYNENVLERLTSPGGRVDIVITSAGRGANDGEDPATSEQGYVAGYDGYWKRLEAVGTKVVVLADSPMPGGSGPRYECVDKTSDYLDCAFEANGGLGTAALRRAAELNPDRVWLDLNPWICPETPDGRCPVVIGGTLVYRQGSHLTKAYVESLTPVVRAELVRAGVIDGPRPTGSGG